MCGNSIPKKSKTKIETPKQNHLVDRIERKHIRLQTDYRDEANQTDPYSPMFITIPGENPEVMNLNDFTYDRGLPVTSIEISFIERLRARRQWASDHSFDMNRKRLMIEREIRQWRIRDKEIQLLQNARLNLFVKNLHDLVELDEDLMTHIVNLFVYRQEKRLTFQYKLIDDQTSRDIRRLKRIHRLRKMQIDSNTRFDHRGVIGTSEGNFGCYFSTKAQLKNLNDSLIPRMKNQAIFTSLPYINTNIVFNRRFDENQLDIFQFEAFLPGTALVPKIDSTDLNHLRSNKLNQRMQNLEKAQQLIEDKKRKHGAIREIKSFRFVEKIETRNSFYQDKTSSYSTETPVHLHHSLVKLQNYLRGIIDQSRIDEVRRIRTDLLKELREEISEKIELEETVSSSQTNINLLRESIYNYLEGVTCGDMLDFLSKELIRLQSEQTIYLFTCLADRYRNQRECIETGNRSKMIEKQKLIEQMLDQMFTDRSATDINSYLEDLILQSISETADRDSRIEIQQATDLLIKMTDQMISQQNDDDAEVYVSELVHQFLIPTVAKVQHQASKNLSKSMGKFKFD